jgi:hypothetical protein
MITIVDLEAEYQLARAALLIAGVDLTGSIDALYRDWRRWRDKPTFRPMDRVRVASVDQWWLVTWSNSEA